jgi:hypothetical protein
MDIVTTEILQRVEQLPLEQKQTALEFVKSLEHGASTPASNGKPKVSREEWRAKLLQVSTWSEEQIHDIENARKWMESSWTNESL